MIGELQAGKPDYERMTANGSQETHRQLALIQAVLAPLGAVESVTFKGVGPAGPDIYTVKFERGVLEYRIWLTDSGKIDAANYRTP